MSQAMHAFRGDIIVPKTNLVKMAHKWSLRQQRFSQAWIISIDKDIFKNDNAVLKNCILLKITVNLHYHFCLVTSLSENFRLCKETIF